MDSYKSLKISSNSLCPSQKFFWLILAFNYQTSFTILKTNIVSPLLKKSLSSLVKSVSCEQPHSNGFPYFPWSGQLILLFFAKFSCFHFSLFFCWMIPPGTVNSPILCLFGCGQFVFSVKFEIVVKASVNLSFLLLKLWFDV